MTGLPANGSALYVTLYSMVGGQWFGNAYTYTAVGGAATFRGDHFADLWRESVFKLRNLLVDGRKPGSLRLLD